MTPALQKKATLSDEFVQNIRFYEVVGGKVYKELSSDYSVAGFNEFVTIYAEQAPQEELEADHNVDRAVFAFHFDKEPNKPHGVPFKFVVKPVSHDTSSHHEQADHCVGRIVQGHQRTPHQAHKHQRQTV